MFKEIIIVLTEPICDCKNQQLRYSMVVADTTYARGLLLSCIRCKKEVHASIIDINGHVRVRILPIIEGGAKVVSLEEAKKEKNSSGIVD